MKTLTKEWVKDLDFNDLIIMLKPNSNKKIPFVFTNGGTEGVAKEDLHTINTDFNFTEKENEISFVMVPYTLELEVNFLNEGTEINERTCSYDFSIQYADRMRIISYLPDDILNLVKDKRLLALGYAEKEVKNAILNYIKPKFRKACKLYEKSDEASVEAEEGLTIHEQFKNMVVLDSLPFLFDGAKISKFEKVKDEIFLTLDTNIKVGFSGAKIIESEVDIVNSRVHAIELYKKENSYELHLLTMKRDKNLIGHYYYVTYAFKDLKFRK